MPPKTIHSFFVKSPSNSSASASASKGTTAVPQKKRKQDSKEQQESQDQSGTSAKKPKTTSIYKRHVVNHTEPQTGTFVKHGEEMKNKLVGATTASLAAWEKDPENQLELRQLSPEQEGELTCGLVAGDIIAYGQRGCIKCKWCGFLKAIRCEKDWTNHLGTKSHRALMLQQLTDRGGPQLQITETWKHRLTNTKSKLAALNAAFFGTHPSISFRAAADVGALSTQPLTMLNPTISALLQEQAALQAAMKELDTKERSPSLTKLKLCVASMGRLTQTLHTNSDLLASSCEFDRRYLPYWLRILGNDTEEGILSKVRRARAVFGMMDEMTDHRLDSNMALCGSMLDPDTGAFRFFVLTVLDCGFNQSGQQLYSTLSDYLIKNNIFNLINIFITDGASNVFQGRGKEKSVGARYASARSEVMYTSSL